MIPLRDDNPRRTFPFITYTLIALNVVAFVWELSLGPRLDEALFRSAFIPARYWIAGNWGFDLFTIVFSMFLHGGLMHIGSNMLYLWIFGDNIEDRLGHAGYLLFYVGCGALAAMAQAVADPLSFVPMIGASGAIAGVMGAYFLLYPQSRILTVVFLVIFLDIIEIPAVFLLGLWFLLQVAHGALSSGEPGGGVAFWAHVGGFAAGAVVGLYLRARRGSERHYWDGAA